MEKIVTREAIKLKNKILFGFGLFLMLIGIVFNIHMFLNECYPTYIFFLIILVGIIQISCSFISRNLLKKWQIFWSLLPIIFWCVFFELTASSKDIFLIPNGFRGKVKIQYNQNNGTEKEFENILWRIYRVPKNGILNTKFKIKGNSISYSKSKYYFINEDGNRKEIKQFCDYCKEKDTLGIRIITGKLSEDENGEYQDFYIDIPKREYRNE